MHAGMSWPRLEELGGIQWPCPSEDSLEPSFLHGRLWADDPAERGRPAPFSVVVTRPAGRIAQRRVPAPAHHRPTPRLVQHRRAVGRLPQPEPGRRDDRPLPRRRPRDRRRPTARSSGRVASRRRRGAGAHRRRPARRLVFMTFHFPDEVDVNQLTIDATDPQVGHRRVQGIGGAHREARGAMTTSTTSTMDLKTRGIAPSAPEREAIESVLGPPASDATHDRIGGGTAACSPAPAAAHAARRQRSGRLDQPGGDRPHRRASRRVAGGDLRRRHVLRPVLHDGATRAAGARLRRPGRAGPGASRRAACPTACTRRPVSGCATRRRRRWSPRPANPARRASLGDVSARQARASSRRVASPLRPIPQAGDPDLVLLARAGRIDPLDFDAWVADGGLARAAAGARDRPRRSDRTRRRRRPARTRRRRLPDRDGSGGRSGPRPPRRATSCATPTNPNPARSRTGR